VNDNDDIGCYDYRDDKINCDDNDNEDDDDDDDDGNDD
jgi:hypothetical protein